MSDADFIAWVQKAQTFDVSGSPGQSVQIIPAEWNYYGGMDSKILNAAVIGVQTRARPDPLGRQRGCSRDGGDWLDGELFRAHHRRQFRRIAAGDPILHRQPDAAERRRDIPAGQAVEGRVPVAEFLPQHQSHGGRRRRRLRLPRHEKE